MLRCKILSNVLFDAFLNEKIPVCELSLSPGQKYTANATSELRYMLLKIQLHGQTKKIYAEPTMESFRGFQLT
jgi:hypothetical protein